MKPITVTPYLFVILLSTLILWGCGSNLARPERNELTTPTSDIPEQSETASTDEPMDESIDANIPLVEQNSNQTSLAEVLSVQASGDPQAYRFSVEISSPDLGCEQYANWWEVVSEEGELLYRRILAHSHVSEQPFSRSGGPVPIEADEVVWVRAHMEPGGYGGAAFKGSVEAGFEATLLDAQFASNLATVAPLPSGCAW